MSVLFIGLLFSCAKNVSTNSIYDVGPWKVIEMTKGSKAITIKLKNTLDSPLNIHNPMDKKVKFKSENEWESVSIRYCECGASCPPPPEVILVEPQGIFTFSWDMQVEECKDENGRMSTAKSKAAEGQYLLTYYYSPVGTRGRELMEIPFEL